MTFSVDVDAWPFKAGPLQDATPRHGAGEGRGKDFASSLFGVAPDGAPSADLILEDSEAATLASLNLMQTFPAPISPVAAEPLTIPVEDIDIQPSDIEVEALTPAPQAAPDIPQLTAAEAPAPDAATLAIPADDMIGDTLPPEVEPAVTADTEPQAPPAEKTAPTEQARPDAATVFAATAPVVPTGGAVIQAPVAAAMAGAASVNKAAIPEPAQPSPTPRRAADAAAQTETSAEFLTELAQEQSSAPKETGLETVNPVDAAANSDTAPQTAAPFISGAPGQPAAPSQTPASALTAQLTPTHAVLTATANHLPEIVARATAEGQDDRVVVQLDPPELGRVSIDFKFDAQGLQHVTITAENPEAMRQLRQMHFELVQALERNGLSGQNMSFQHQNPQQNEGWGQQAKLSGTRFDTPALTTGGLILAADNLPHRQTASSGRLDIRL